MSTFQTSGGGAVRFVVNTNGLDSVTKAMADRVKRIPRRLPNPLVALDQWYVLRLEEMLRSRPAVSEDGDVGGANWPAHKPMYIRKTDGQVVPRWGDVPRAIISFGGRARQLLGTVTNASGYSIRLARELTEPQRRAGYGIVESGQVFSQATVLGQLRKDGTRYQAGTPQLGVTKGDGMLNDWLSSNLIISLDGKKTERRSSKPYGAVHAFGSKDGNTPARLWHFFPAIQAEFEAKYREFVTIYLREVFKESGVDTNG